VLKKLMDFCERKSMPGTETVDKEAISFKTNLGIHSISKVLVKVTELCSFTCYAVKHGDREVTAVGTGSYDEQAQTVKINGMYPVLDASGGGASVTITARGHQRLQRTLDYWKEEDEVAIIHSHPSFSSMKSDTDDQHAIRMACLLFGGVVVMIIIDPFSEEGIDVSAYAIEPETKAVQEIPFELVP
jgi:hypothetical protein